MLNFTRLIITSRFIVQCGSLAVKRQVTKVSVPYYFPVIHARNMAQKSITSFFAATPKKPTPIKHEPEDDNVEAKSNGASSKADVKEKRSSKRQRLESSGSESNTSPPPVTPSSDKKKKVKRQRIESSSSETDSEPKPISPKVKKGKSNSKPSPKVKVSPGNQKTKCIKSSPLTTKNVKENGNRSPSPKSKVKVKKEVLSPTAETNKKTVKKEKVENKSKKGDKEDIKENEETPQVSELEYDPTLASYHPIRDACWARAAPVPYLALARTLRAVEATPARTRMVDALANFLRSVIALTPQDLLPSVYLCLNQLAPAYHSLELGIAETYLMKAVGQSTGASLAQVRAAAARCGDLGEAAAAARRTQRTMFAPPPLAVRAVLAALRDVARMTGHASVNKKIAKIQSLFTACRDCEAKYLIRSLEGKLRVGLAEQSVLQALALAAARTPPLRDLPAPDQAPPTPDQAMPTSGQATPTPNQATPTPDQAPPTSGQATPAPDQATPAPGQATPTPDQAPPAPDQATPTPADEEAPPPPARRTPEQLDASRGLTPEQFKAVVDEHALIIKTTYCECPNYDAIVPALLRHGVAALPRHCRLAPGVPLKPMLAHPTRGVHEVLNRFENEEFTCEWKYDGERAQIHVPEAAGAPDLARAQIFSRNQENNTSKYPDVLGRLSSLLAGDVTSCVLDCEAVAYDTVEKKILPFQILSTRKRKEAVESEIKVQVCVFVFDLLYLNGRPLVREPLIERRRLLREHFREAPGIWQFATSRDCSSGEEVQQWLEEAVRGSCEGLMVKTLRGERARYDIARRSHSWLKLKKDYLEGVGDTLDLVVLGGYRGKGRRAGVFGGFLLGCADAAGERYQAICKIGTGFSDDDLQKLTEELNNHVIDAPRNYYSYDKSHEPDAWFAAASVWEVRCADISLSPAHRAAIGLVHPDHGLSLRFPRFIRVRTDKAPEQATSARQVADMYLAQDQVRNTAKKHQDLDDFY